MKAFELYQQILGLTTPWRVAQVTLKAAAQEVEVRVGHADTIWGCPVCQQRMPLHACEERRWRHLDSCPFQTVLGSRVPVVTYSEHGTQTVAVPWAEQFARFTGLFERLAIDVPLECSITGAGAVLGISWDEADGIKPRAVKQGLAPKRPMGMPGSRVDKKGVGHGHDCLTLVAHAEARRTTVQYAGVGRDQEGLDAFGAGLLPEPLAGVEAVAVDIRKPCVQSPLNHLPGAAGQIVQAPFHLVKYINTAVNEVRQAEQRRLHAQCGDTLKRTRGHSLYGMENVPASPALRFAAVKELKLQTARAWGIKEVFRNFWLWDTLMLAGWYFARWYSWAIRSRLDPVKKVARLCKRHLGNLLKFFEHRHTIGPMEALRDAIHGLIKKAYGYRDKERFKTDILLHPGGFEAYPTL